MGVLVRMSHRREASVDYRFRMKRDRSLYLSTVQRKNTNQTYVVFLEVLRFDSNLYDQHTCSKQTLVTEKFGAIISSHCVALHFDYVNSRSREIWSHHIQPYCCIALYQHYIGKRYRQ